MIGRQKGWERRGLILVKGVKYGFIGAILAIIGFWIAAMWGEDIEAKNAGIEQAYSSGQTDRRWENELELDYDKQEIGIGEYLTWQINGVKAEFEKIGAGKFRCNKSPVEAVKIMLLTQVRIFSYFQEPNDIIVEFPACSSGLIDKCDRGCIAHPFEKRKKEIMVGYAQFKGQGRCAVELYGKWFCVMCGEDIDRTNYWSHNCDDFEPHDPPIMSDTMHGIDKKTGLPNL